MGPSQRQEGASDVRQPKKVTVTCISTKAAVLKCDKLQIIMTITLKSVNDRSLWNLHEGCVKKFKRENPNFCTLVAAKSCYADRTTTKCLQIGQCFHTTNR